MSTATQSDEQTPAFDDLLVTLATYASQATLGFSDNARASAALCLMDAIACATGALEDEDCRRVIGPVVPGAELRGGARVPCTRYELDPVRAAFSAGTLIRWLDFSDTTANGGHPSDNIGALLGCADYVDRTGKRVLTMADVHDALVIAYEIQGRIAHAFKFDAPAVGLDAVIGVKIASSIAATRLLGGSYEQMLNAVSCAFVDGATLNAYRQPPNSGTRKGWAGPRASAVGVEIALMAVGGEMGYPSALTAKPWGFFEVMLGGQPIELRASLASGIVENVIFKLHPCQRNATTAAEAALQLHPVVLPKLDRVRTVHVHTHAEALERIDNPAMLRNAAARDHSLQFIVATALVHGELTTAHYHEPLAGDARVAALIPRMRLLEEPAYTAGYAAPIQPSTGNAIEVAFDDGTSTAKIEVLYPGGHPARRNALRPLLEAKFMSLAQNVFCPAKIDELRRLFFDPGRLAEMRVRDFMSLVSAPTA